MREPSSLFRMAGFMSRRSTARSYKGTPAEYNAGFNRAIALGWLELHESGTFVKFTQAGADLFV
ncbi:hypothetical protein ACFIOY_40095 [Bradyrhizobium sp. TZ2]